MNRLAMMAIAALLTASAAQAAGNSPTDIVNRHVSSGGNIDAIVADYADDAVVLQSGRAVRGKAAIRTLFEGMFQRRPAATAPAAAASSPAPAPRPAGGGMKVTRVWEEGNIGFVSWEMGPVKATEEFVIRDGKIQVQAIFLSGGAPVANP